MLKYTLNIYAQREGALLMRRPSSRLVNYDKAAGVTVAVNILQILGALTVTAFSLATGGHAFMGMW